MNAVEIEEAITALSQQPFDPVEFPFELLASFGVKDATINRLRKGETNKSDCGGVLKRQDIHILVTECGEALAGLDKLRESKATITQKCPLLLSTDGHEVHIESLEDGVTHALDFENLADGFGVLLPLAGISTIKEIRESAFDIKATGRLNRLYVALLNNNPDWAGAGMRDELNHFMARLIFCFFAEDTSIFTGDDAFTQVIERMTEGDGSNVHQVLETLFSVMDVPFDQRDGKGLPNYCLKFPYVNGNLFSGIKATPKFDRQSRNYLLHIGRLDWTKINPDIFGSMIQAITEDDERSSLGQHYTSVPSILKVLNPLFLDELNEALEQAGDNTRKLLNLKKRIARIRVFDPACGSGNFLVIAYKELRKLEAEINRRRKDPDTRTVIPLTNFRGIEIKGFSAEVARLALVIAEYQCNVEHRGQNEALEEFLPLATDNWITHGNALELDWAAVCPPSGEAQVYMANDSWMADESTASVSFENEGGEVYICGNPPYLGSNSSSFSKAQKAEIESVARRVKIKSWKKLDYVCGWLIKGAQYLERSNQRTSMGLVTTNSLCQGAHVNLLWPQITSDRVVLFYAYTSFKWSNLATHNAGVTVVILGMTNQPRAVRHLYHSAGNDKGSRQECSVISPYLIAGDYQPVRPATKNKFGNAHMTFGNMAADGGNLLMSHDELQELGLTSAQRKTFVQRFLGSQEFNKGTVRYCLWIHDKDFPKAMEIPSLKSRIEATEKNRLSSKDSGTRSLALRPHQFREFNSGKVSTLIVPRVSSENREFLPVGMLPSTSIVSDSAFALFDAPIWNLALIASTLHLVWIKTVCGKLKTDYRYSNTLGWNTFPIPKLTQQNRNDLTRTAENILLVREAHYPKTITDLYKPSEMPANLRSAHEENDEVLERIYMGRRFRNDTERLGKLFSMYEKAVARDKG